MTADPLDQFAAEHRRAAEAGVELPTAITLATVDARGRPRARMVLFKDVDGRGVTFFTNYQSDKAADLEAIPFAALCVYWHPTRKQFRIAGPVERLTEAESDAYFATRPRGSQIGAWASEQSRPLASIDELKAKVTEFEAKFEGRDVPRPPHWGGFRVLAEEVEIWTEGEYRLHDRRRFVREADGWVETRLNP